VLIQVPRIEGVPKDLTLTKIILNGVQVRQGDVLAEFDAVDEVKALRDAQAKFDDLRHQVEQKVAEHQNNAEKRVSELKQAQADLDKAELEIRKGPILSAIEDEKNQVKLADAKEHVASLQRSAKARDISEQAEIRVLELQRDRQQIAVDRAKGNAGKLVLHSPFNGMVALANTWRNDSMGHAQEGDQMWPGSPLLSVFDPSSMEVEVAVGEPDGAVLVRRRPPKGLLGGMMEIPSTPWRAAVWTSTEAASSAPAPQGIKTGRLTWRTLPGAVSHTFTHFHLELQVMAVDLPARQAAKFNGQDHKWVPLDAIGDAGLPSVMAKIARHALAHLT